jgi:hypothetical protein
MRRISDYSGLTPYGHDEDGDVEESSPRTQHTPMTDGLRSGVNVVVVGDLEPYWNEIDDLTPGHRLNPAMQGLGRSSQRGYLPASDYLPTSEYTRAGHFAADIPPEWDSPEATPEEARQVGGHVVPFAEGAQERQQGAGTP